MNFQVWTHDEYEGWKREDCADIQEVQKAILKALTSGKDPLVTVEVPFDVDIKIKEDKIGEVTPRETKLDKGPGAPGKGPVRPGDPGPVQKLDQRSRASSPGDSLPGK